MHTKTTMETGAQTMAHQRRRQHAREQHEGATLATVRTQAQTTRETATAAQALEPRGKNQWNREKYRLGSILNFFPQTSGRRGCSPIQDWPGGQRDPSQAAATAPRRRVGAVLSLAPPQPTQSREVRRGSSARPSPLSTEQVTNVDRQEREDNPEFI